MALGSQVIGTYSCVNFASSTLYIETLMSFTSLYHWYF